MRKLFNLFFLIIVFSFAIIFVSALVSAESKNVNVNVVVVGEDNGSDISDVSNVLIETNNRIQGKVVEVDKQTNVESKIISFFGNIEQSSSKAGNFWIFSFIFVGVILLLVIYLYRHIFSKTNKN